MKRSKALTRTLIFDIETAPMEVYMWAMWQKLTSTTFINNDWYVLCWSAKWLGEKEIISKALIDYPAYKKDKRDDCALMVSLYKLLDEADVVVAHNGIKFDVRKVNARFLVHGLTPPSPYSIVDTLFSARKQFAFTSNRLDDLGKALGVGKKIKHSGFDLWRGCLDGDMKSWKKMIKYCANDVKLLERVYRKLLPYMKRHPNQAPFGSERSVCSKCGSTDVQYRGFAYTAVSKFRRFVCKDCGAWSRESQNLLKGSRSRQSL